MVLAIAKIYKRQTGRKEKETKIKENRNVRLLLKRARSYWATFEEELCEMACWDLATLHRPDIPLLMTPSL